jgi:DNA-binding transcriptional regulator PaaX
MQNSVWITPDPLTGEREVLGQSQVDVGSLLLMEARPCAGESNEEIVAGAWDFAAIDLSYQRHARVLERLPRRPLAGETAARALRQWLREDRLAWQEVLRLDPLLPKCLHPAGYAGVNAWQRRLGIMAEAGRCLRSFRLPA